MKKMHLLFCALMATVGSFAQTIPNAGMEVWRSNLSGTDSAEVVQSPDYWFGQDSTVIALGQSFGTLLSIPNKVWDHQLFIDSTDPHTGAYDAKILTTYQDDTALLPGTLSNGQANVGITLSPPGISGITCFGGLPVTVRPTTVRAWVRYFPGKDTVHNLFGGPDTAVLNVVAISRLGGTVGTGVVLIGPASAWTQITANLVYTETINTADTLRITFASSGGATQTLDSSILYVDDVTMTSNPEVSYVGVGVKNVVGSNQLVNLYPNPTASTLYISGPQNAGLSLSLLSVSGQVVATKTLSGNDILDVSGLSAGMYVYTISNHAGNTVQQGKVTITR